MMKKLSFFLFCFICSISGILAQTINVSTFAGTGSAGSADGTAMVASFWSPSGIVFDAAGNSYITDRGNHKIRKITPDGEVTTFAGSGVAGFSNGTGTAASFNQPFGITIDASGNLYVGDNGNHSIRKITPAGVVTTLAGNGASGSANGTGTGAQFYMPYGVAVDAFGNVYVADYGNHRIRKITPSGVVTTFAGGSNGFLDGTGTAARFFRPAGLAFDASGNLYVADRNNNRIRKITPAGVVTTLAGSGTSGSDDGIGTVASFSNPYDVAVHASGNLYVADQGNNKIRKVTPAGVVTTHAGNGNWGFADGAGAVASFKVPTGVAIDTYGNVYVADDGNHRIRIITENNGTQTNVSCYGESTGTATVVPIGGTAPYSFSWTPSGGTDATATGLSAGLYTVTITDANNDTEFQTFVISQPSALNTTAGTKTDVSCNGGSNGTATVNPTGGTAPYTYSWSPSGGTAQTASGLAAGTYTVTVYDANACPSTKSFTIEQPATVLNASAGEKTDVSCFGGSNGTATVNPTGGTEPYTYSWSPSGGANATATGLAAGTYTVTVYDANACPSTKSFTIEQPAALNTSAGEKTDVSCFGGSNGTATVNPTGGTEPYTYSWSPSGGTTQTASGLAAGSYTVTVYDANACPSTKSFTIEQPATALNTSAGEKTDVSCFGGSNGTATVNPTGGTAPYTYSWSPSGGTAQTATGLATGTYTVAVTDTYGCSDVKSFTIEQPAIGNVETETACESFYWNGDTYSTSGTYTFEYVNGDGCPSTDTLHLTINQPTSSSLSVTECSSYTWAENNQTYTESGAYTHVIPNANNCDSTITLNLTINQPTSSSLAVTECSSYTWAENNQTYTESGAYTHVIPNANNCDSTITLNLTINQPTSSSLAVTECSSYTWAENNQTYTASGSYTHIVPNANNCDSTITLNLTINQPTSSSLAVTECSSYTWLENNQTYTESGAYTHVVPNANNCDSTITLNLTINTIDNTVSVNGIELTANETGATYQWIDCDDNDAPIAGETAQTFVATANGNYAVEITLNGCTETSTCIAVTSVGIASLEANNSWNVYPNPNNGIFTVSTSQLQENTLLEIYSQDGRLIYSTVHSGTETTIDLQNESRGVYILKVNNTNHFRVIKN